MNFGEPIAQILWKQQTFFDRPGHNGPPLPGIGLSFHLKKVKISFGFSEFCADISLTLDTQEKIP